MEVPPGGNFKKLIVKLETSEQVTFGTFKLKCQQ